MKRILKGMTLILCLLMVAVATVLAQDACEGNFDCDSDVDGTDAAVFKEDFGRSPFNDPCPDCTSICDPPTPLGKTGQTICYDETGAIIDCIGTGQDGEYQKGVNWPNPRFTDNNNGTVTDNLTGLIWLKNANCFGERTWNQALSDCNTLAHGQCELSDGSSVGDWRLPNRFELVSLLDLEYYGAALPNTAGTGQWSAGDPFNNVRSADYWTSTTYMRTPYTAYTLYIWSGNLFITTKTYDGLHVWPVRDPL